MHIRKGRCYNFGSSDPLDVTFPMFQSQRTGLAPQAHVISFIDLHAPIRNSFLVPYAFWEIRTVTLLRVGLY